MTPQTTGRLSPKYAKINFIATFDEQKILTTEYSANKWDVTKAFACKDGHGASLEFLNTLNIPNAVLTSW